MQISSKKNKDNNVVGHLSSQTESNATQFWDHGFGFGLRFWISLVLVLVLVLVLSETWFWIRFGFGTNWIRWFWIRVMVLDLGFGSASWPSQKGAKGEPKGNQNASKN